MSSRTENSREENLRSLHHDCDPIRVNCFVDRQGNLPCEAFLHLKTTTERFSYSGKFGESENKFSGNVPN
jgi:hypothetical protein